MGLTLVGWAEFYETTPAKADAILKDGEAEGWVEIARTDRGLVFMRSTQRAIERDKREMAEERARSAH